MPDSERLRQLLAEATPGPWLQTPNPALVVARSYEGPRVAVAAKEDERGITMPQEANAALIVAAVNALPELLDQRDELAEALTSIHNQSKRASIRRIAARALARSVGDSQ